MKPVVDGVMQAYAGKVELRRLDANDPANQKVADQFGVQYVPTFVFINGDGTRSDEVVGAMSADDVRRRLDALK